MKLVNDVKHWWRMWSVRLNALGLALLGWVAIDPVSVLYVWNMMPGHVRERLPVSLVGIIGAVLFGLSLVARLVRQPKLETKENPDAENR